MDNREGKIKIVEMGTFRPLTEYTRLDKKHLIHKEDKDDEIGARKVRENV
jgi:hypothetical protein